MNKVYIIAEVGVNHNGDLAIARKLISAAVDAGANAVKFQTFKAKDVASRHADQAQYQTDNTGNDQPQLELLRKLELSYESHIILIEYCKQKSIDFISTPLDTGSIRYLDSIGLNTFKISSGEVTNYPFLKTIGELNKKLILSTGMSSLEEVGDAIGILVSSGTKKDNISVLHCHTEYPTSFKEVNLLAMVTMKNAFKVKVGYSDHTMGIDVPIAATALGAEIIEKHFTLSRESEGPDHKASLEPDELKAMVASIRNVEMALGDGIKTPSAKEMENIKVSRKSIVAAVRIKKGEVFTEKNITTKRPGNGVSAMRWNDVIGVVSKRDYEEDELIEL